MNASLQFVLLRVVALGVVTASAQPLGPYVADVL
jgi:hypothetical protein